jgi:Tol biopolymer transport system component
MKASWTRPRISPDGKRAVVRKVGDNCELWLLDLERGTMSRALQAGDNHEAAWAPDGRHLAVQQMDSPVRMVTVAIDGARDLKVISQGSAAGGPCSWSDGGNRLAYTVNGRGSGSDIWVQEMGGSAPAAPFLATESSEADPAFSSDGNWIAYTSNEGGTFEVYIRHYPDNGSSWQVSNGGGNGPLWSRDGRSLYYASSGKMMSVSIDRGNSLQVGTPVELFEGGFNTERSREYDESPDGRFLAVQRSGGNSGKRELRMVLNWAALLNRGGSGRAH